MTLQPCDIAAIYTADEILAEIAEIKNAIKTARESISDEFSDTQASQKVKRSGVATLNKDLAVHIKAYNLLTGKGCSTIKLTSANYTPSEPRI